MLNAHSIKSGNNCTNLQINNLDYIKGLSADDLKGLREEITQAILSQAQKERELERIGGKADEHSISCFGDRAEASIDPKDLVSLLESWRENQLRGQQTSSLEIIISEGVSTILNSPKVASFVLENIVCHPLIKSIVLPACKLSLESEISIKELVSLLDAVSNSESSPINYFSIPLQLYLIRILFSILYQNRTENEDQELAQVLSDAALHEHSLIGQFYVDAYFRVKLNYLHISNVLSVLIDDRANEYFSRYPNHPLTQLQKAVIKPVEIYEEYDIETVQEDLSKLALLCQNVIEARWIVTTLLRLLPLYKTEDLDLDYDKSIEGVTRNFSTDISSKFHFLAYTNLRSMLYIFNMTGNVSYLVNYEKTFVAKKEVLTWYQLIALQIEYSSVIYMYLLNNGLEAMSDTKFFHLVEMGGHAPIESVLFSNIFVIDDSGLLAFPGGAGKGQLLKWLYSYINKIYVSHTEKQLTINPYQLFNYRATSKVPLLRARIVSLVTNFIKEEDSSDHISASPSYASKILSLVEFARASNAFDCGRKAIWIDSAMRSDKYNILLNAKALAYTMYSLRYYCANKTHEPSQKLGNKLKQMAEFYNKPPRLYMATTECLSIRKRKQELEFVVLLQESLIKANRKLFQLSLRRDEVFNLIIPDETINIFHDFEQRGAVLAHVGMDYMLVPEYWNLLATTIFNLKYPDEVRSLNIASMFYSVAKCFAREQRGIDQKYSYNYIRTRSLYHMLSNSMPTDSFVRDCSFYIDRPNNQYFSFKKDCCRPFFKLIKIHYNDLPMDIKDLYTKQIIPKHHWIKSMFFDLKIGIFADEIRIK